MSTTLDEILAKLDSVEDDVKQIKKASILREIRGTLVKACEGISKLNEVLLKQDYKAHMKECMPREMKDKDFKGALRACVTEWKDKNKCEPPEDEKETEKALRD